jgi:hypothetical protein
VDFPCGGDNGFIARACSSFVVRLLESSFVESIDAGLPDLLIDGGWGAAAANAADALAIDGYRQPSFDTDEPARAHGERLRQHLVVRDFAAVASRLAGSGGCQRGATTCFNSFAFSMAALTMMSQPS